jgi:transposase
MFSPNEKPLVASSQQRQGKSRRAKLAKRQHREREHLVQERVRIENRIEVLLATQGVRKRPSLRSWDRDLENLRTGDGRPIPVHLRAELARLHRRLVMTIAMIREVLKWQCAPKQKRAFHKT